MNLQRFNVGLKPAWWHVPADAAGQRRLYFTNGSICIEMPRNNQLLSLLEARRPEVDSSQGSTRRLLEQPRYRFLRRLPGGKALEAGYAVAAELAGDGRCPFRHYLQHLEVEVKVSKIDFGRIPRQGPLMVVANHPYGGLDGLMLGSIIARARADFKILGNHLRDGIAAVGDAIISVDVLKTRGSMRTNSRALRRAID